MKILNFTNQADFLPRYPELKIVLFDNHPTLYSKEYNLTTNAKLWYHFHTDTMWSSKFLYEKGGVKLENGDEAVRNIHWRMNHPDSWIDVGKVYTASFEMGRLAMFEDPLNSGKIITLMPYCYSRPLVGGSYNRGYVWQSMPEEFLDFDDMFTDFCDECLGIFDNTSQKKYRKILERYLVPRK